eukprot:6537220-Alexandrium_andersonii.AAC.1
MPLRAEIAPWPVAPAALAKNAGVVRVVRVQPEVEGAGCEAACERFACSAVLDCTTLAVGGGPHTSPEPEQWPAYLPPH